MSDSLKQTAGSAAIRSPGPLESPILSFDLNAEIARLRSENAWQGGRNSKTLVKHPDFSRGINSLEIECAPSRTQSCRSYFCPGHRGPHPNACAGQGF